MYCGILKMFFSLVRMAKFLGLDRGALCIFADSGAIPVTIGHSRWRWLVYLSFVAQHVHWVGTQ